MYCIRIQAFWPIHRNRLLRQNAPCSRNLWRRSIPELDLSRGRGGSSSKRSGVKDEEALGFRIPRKERNHVAGNPLSTFTQDFNTSFLQTSNSGTARSELVNVSENRVCESRRQQDPNPPAEAPESSESRNQKRRRLEIQSDQNWNSDCPTSRQDLGWPEKVAGENSVLKFRAAAAGGAGPQGRAEQAT